MELPVRSIPAILGSKSETDPFIARGYSIDSRTVQPGDLFFALRGPRYDGHDFVAQTLEKGGVAAVVREDYQPALPVQSRRLIRVGDPAQALRQLAGAVRQQWTGRLVGITGSTGKTTTKEMAADVLGRRYPTLKSPGNLNNQYGVPLTLLRLEPAYEVAVIEMAMSGPGEIARLALLAGPQTGVVTNVGPAHLEFFDSVDSIANAKRELIENLQPPQTAVLNYDDERVRRFQEGFKGRVVTFGFSEGSDYRALRVHASQEANQVATRTEFEVQGPAYSGWFSIPLPGRHNVENALAAIAVASLFDIDRDDLRAALASLRLPGQRAEILELSGGVRVVNDAYNSNPRAMERMIETLVSWPGAKRRIVVAGEMLELGDASAEWHRHIGRECARAGIGWLIGVQGDARFLLEGAQEAGLSAAQTAFFPMAREAGQFCRSIMLPGDVILVKGSRGVRLEEAIEALRRTEDSPH